MCSQSPKNELFRPCASKKFNYFNHKGGDRLSSLPDEILTRIISFLPRTEDVIRTSVFATRWEYLWTCVPSFEFKTEREAEYKCFINIADRLLLLHDLGDHDRLGIEKFSVQFGYNNTKVNPNIIDAWISSLIIRNVKEINLVLPDCLVCLLPSSLFTCKTLVSLKLHGKFKFDTSTSSVFLPNLKVLNLTMLQYSNEEEMVSRLLFGCPILEILTIMRYPSSGDDVKLLNIVLLSLKWLSLNVVSVEVSEHLVPSLIGPLLLAISNVKTLTLGAGIISHLRIHNQHLPTFRNVRDLKLSMNVAKSAGVLMNILESMPKLQKLAIEALAIYYVFVSEWSPPEDVPVCLSSHLKTFEIHELCGDEDEVKLIKYLKENGKVLEKMIFSPLNRFSPWDVFGEDKWLVSKEIVETFVGF